MKAIIFGILSLGFTLQINAQSNNSNGTNPPTVNNTEAEKPSIIIESNSSKNESIPANKKKVQRSEKAVFELKEEKVLEKEEADQSNNVNDNEMLLKADDTNINTQTFDQNFATFSTSNYDISKAPSLFIAAQLQPENLEVQKQLLGYYVITNKDQAFDSLAEKVSVKEGRSEADYNYFGDLCSSVSQNSTLVLHGVTDFNLNYETRDCYEKQNVELISFEYLPSENYQQQLSEKGFKLPETSEFNPAYLQAFCELNQDKNIYLSMTFPKEYLKPIQKNLVPVGLSFHYGYTSNPNEMNQTLWENSWKKTISDQKQTTFSDALSKNYIPSLLVLRKYYSQLGFSNEIKTINEKIEAIGKRANIPSETIQTLIK